MSHKDAWQEARRENGPIGKKLMLFPLFIVVLLLVVALSGKTLVQQSIAAGASSAHVAIASEWGSILVIGALVGYFFVSKWLKVTRFCHEMCERGQKLEAEREKA